MTRQPDLTQLPYRPCVGVVLCNRDGRVFAAERVDTPDAWQMPQGGIDTGEDPRAAALRELTEETSVPADQVRVEAETSDWIAYDLPADLVPRVWGGKFRGQKQKWFRMGLVGPEALIDLDTRHPEFSRWQWMTPDELIAAIVPFKRDLYRAVLAELMPAADLTP